MIYYPPRCPNQKFDYHSWIFPFVSAFMSSASLLPISSTVKMSLNLLISPPTIIHIFSLLNYCRSFLIGLPVSRETTFHSTHRTAARVRFLKNKSDLVAHKIKIHQGIPATSSVKIQTPEHGLQRLFLIWLLCLSSATQDLPPWASQVLVSCHPLWCFSSFAHAVPMPGTAFSSSTPSTPTHSSGGICSGQLFPCSSVCFLKNDLMHIPIVIFTSLYFNSLFMY